VPYVTAHPVPPLRGARVAQGEPSFDDLDLADYVAVTIGEVSRLLRHRNQSDRRAGSPGSDAVDNSMIKAPDS
jgi:hypothetical protein